MRGTNDTPVILGLGVLPAPTPPVLGPPPPPPNPPPAATSPRLKDVPCPDCPAGAGFVVDSTDSTPAPPAPTTYSITSPGITSTLATDTIDPDPPPPPAPAPGMIVDCVLPMPPNNTGSSPL